MKIPYFNFKQTYPLPELKDVYEIRRKKKTTNVSESSWDEIRAEFSYPWGGPILDALLKYSPGDTKRKRFIRLTAFRDFVPFDRIMVAFKKKWILVYLFGKPENSEEILKQAMGNDADIGEWRDGYSVRLHSERDGKRFMQWLQIGDKSSKAA